MPQNVPHHGVEYQNTQTNVEVYIPVADAAADSSAADTLHRLAEEIHRRAGGKVENTGIIPQRAQDIPPQLSLYPDKVR